MAMKNAVSKSQIASRVGKTNGTYSKGKMNAGTPAKQVSTLKK